jgi:hypothetical protein
VLVRPRIAARLESLSSIRTQRWSAPPGQEPVAKAEPIQPDDGQCGGLWFARHGASGSGFLLHWFATWEPKPKPIPEARIGWVRMPTESSAIRKRCGFSKKGDIWNLTAAELRRLGVTHAYAVGVPSLAPGCVRLEPDAQLDRNPFNNEPFAEPRVLYRVIDDCPASTSH